MDQFQDASLLSIPMKRRLLYILTALLWLSFLLYVIQIIFSFCKLQNLNRIYTYAYFKRLDYFSTECKCSFSFTVQALILLLGFILPLFPFGVGVVFLFIFFWGLEWYTGRQVDELDKEHELCSLRSLIFLFSDLHIIGFSNIQLAELELIN